MPENMNSNAFSPPKRRRSTALSKSTSILLALVAAVAGALVSTPSVSRALDDDGLCSTKTKCNDATEAVCGEVEDGPTTYICHGVKPQS